MLHGKGPLAVARDARWPLPGDKFNPAMLTIAREAQFFTQKDLAAKINVSQALVGKWESELSHPSGEQIDDLAQALQVHRDFFCVDRSNRLASMSDFYHRALTKASRKNLKAVHARCNFADIQIDRLLEISDPTEDRIPDIDPDNHAGNAEKIAMMARTAMGIDRGPIKNLVEVIERCGGIVIDTYIDVDEVDALCRWVPGLPKLFFINGSKPTDRVRFSLAHELGHTVMHFGRDFENKLAEDQANAFAAALLMPTQEVRRDFKPSLSLADLAALKRKWRVSMQALAYRARQVGAIDETRYRSLYIQMSRKGWRKTEPVSIDGESPQVFRDLINRHLESGYSPDELAKMLFMTPEDISRLIDDANAPTWSDNGVRLRLRR